MPNLSSITNANAAPQIVATGTLAAGQTDIGLSVSFQVNQYPAAQLGAVLVYVNGQLMLRNTGNATAAPAADGNYQEVDAGSGFSSLIRLNVADPLNARPYAIISNGFNIAQPSTTVQSQIQTLQTQQDNMATTLAEVAGIAVSSLYTPLNDATRATFASQFTTLQSDAALKNVSNTWTQPQLMLGQTNGAAIPTGYIGERLAPGAEGFTGVSVVANTVVVLKTLTIPAGVWLVEGFAMPTVGTLAGGTYSYMGLSTNGTGTAAADVREGQAQMQMSTAVYNVILAARRYLVVGPAGVTITMLGVNGGSSGSGSWQDVGGRSIQATRIA